MYNINSSKIKDEQGVSYDTYGISYEDIEIQDVSTDKTKVEKLVNLCNELDLSPIHLNDVLEDFLVDNNI